MIRNSTIDLDEMLARAGDGVFVIDPNGRIVLWNRAAERILGYPAREAIGRLCCDLFTGVDDHGNRLCYRGCHVMTLVKMGEAVQSFDMQTRTRSGRPLWLNVSVLALPPEKQGSALTVHLVRDITATKELLTMVHDRLTAPAPADDRAPASTLTRRELEILRVMATGANTRVAAEKLHVSPSTIRNHAQNIFGKLNVHSRLEAVAYAMTHRLL
jgi:PAS domain S-box-containing protein